MLREGYPFRKSYGTSVHNPTHRSGSNPYTKCLYCGLKYTHLGIGRHWGKCKENPKNKITTQNTGK